MKLDWKKIAGAVTGIVLGTGFILFCPEVGLTNQGVRCLGILIGAIAWWIAGVLPEYATGLLMVVMFALVGGIDTDIAFSAFASDTWWLLVAAFGLGAGMKMSGLMRRMALAIVRTFPNTFIAQVAGIMAAGTVLGPLVPSLTVKTSLLTPIAMSIGDAFGYERYSKPMQGLFLAMLCGVRNVGPAVISASVVGYALWGLYPADVQAQFDMLHWLIAALPWFALVTIMNFAAITGLYHPREENADQSDASSPSQSNNATEAPVSAHRARGAEKDAEPSPMSRHEKQMFAIILITVALWIAEPLHHVSAHVVALAAFVAVIACGILGKRDLRNEISWESLVFIGTVFGLSAVFEKAGITEWIVSAAGPLFEALAENPYLFVLGIGVITILLRFVIVSEMAYINIVMVFLIPLATSFGVNPWIVGFAIYATVNPWFVLYQNPVYLAAYYSVDGNMVHHADMARYCALYMAFCLIALAISVPYWQWMGLL